MAAVHGHVSATLALSASWLATASAAGTATLRLHALFLRIASVRAVLLTASGAERSLGVATVALEAEREALAVTLDAAAVVALSAR